MYRGYTNNDQMSLSSASGQFKSKPLAAEKRVTLESINWLVESGGKQVFYKKEKKKNSIHDSFNSGIGVAGQWV